MSKQPRILLVLTEFPPRIGGMQTHALALATHLHDRGYPLRVVTYRANRHEEKNAAVNFDAHLPFTVERTLSRLGFWHNLDLIARECQRFRADLVYSSTVFYGYLRKELEIPVICRSVGNDVMRPWIAYPFRFGSRLVGSAVLEQPLYDLFKKFNYPEWIEVLFRNRRRQVMAESARMMDLVMANSDFTAELLQELGIKDDRIQVLVGGVDVHRFRCPSPQRIRKKMRLALGLPPKCFLITTACRMVAKKGVDFLLDSLPEIRRRMPDVHLLVIGAGRHEGRYRRQAKRLGLGEHVTFAGRIVQDQIQKYYWASNLFVLASRLQVNPLTGLKDAETMGRVLCEANAAGLPVVASRSGGIPSVIKHERNGLLFEPDNVRELLRMIGRVRRDKHLRRRLIEKGQELARAQFDWSVVVSVHEKAIRRVLKFRTKRRAGSVPVPSRRAVLVGS